MDTVTGWGFVLVLLQPLPKYTWIKILSSEIPVLSSSMAITLVCNLTVSQAKLFSGKVQTCFSGPPRTAGRPASPTTHCVHKVTGLLHVQAHQSCPAPGFWPNWRKTRFPLQTQGSCKFREPVCLSTSARPQPQPPICTPVHASTVVSNTSNIWLVGNKTRKTLRVVEQGHYPSHAGLALHLAEDWHKETQPCPTKRAERRFICPVSLRSASPAPGVGQRLFPFGCEVEHKWWGSHLNDPRSLRDLWTLHHTTLLQVKLRKQALKSTRAIILNYSNSFQTIHILQSQLPRPSSDRCDASPVCISNESPNSWILQSHHVDSHPAQKEMQFRTAWSVKPSR